MNKKYYASFILYSCLLFIGLVSCKRDGDSQKSDDNEERMVSTPPLFTLLDPDHTNVHFQNKLVEGLNTNVLMYEYLYNGGGVATGDFNGDDLIDIYFTSNMGENQLYTNQGKLSFKDVTTAAKVGGRPGPWKTGITTVDINGDNKLDLYLSYSGALPPEKRKNQLFINLGNNQDNIPVFEDQAAKYGLDSPAFTNQAYFFDYDRDGDLDMLLLNHNPKSLPILNEVKTREFLKKDDQLQGVRLYQQTKGVFNDVTVKSKISGSALTYGLGLGVSDLNNDGWVDFYVSNDYAVPDYLYINNGNGTFTDRLHESMGHTSHFSMGNDVADINNDGFQDIITLDMLPEDNHRQKLLLAPDNYEKFDLNVRSGFHHQYMRNMLQLNNGNGTFSEIGQLAGISNTDWSWAALLADYDNDGWKDLYITNGYNRDYTNLDFINYMDSYVKSKPRFEREDVLEIIKEMPASDLTNYMFSNDHGIEFINNTINYGLNQPANSNGAAYADLDNDGDLDLVVNNINKPAFIYRNETQDLQQNYLQIRLKGEGRNTVGIGSRVAIYTNGQKQVLEQTPTKGYLSSVSPILHFGLNKTSKLDSITIQWNSGKVQTIADIEANQVLTLSEKDASTNSKKTTISPSIFEEITTPVNFMDIGPKVNDFKRQSLLTMQYSYTGPCMAKGDFNGDGLEDIFVGGAKEQSAAIFIQGQHQKFIKKASNDFAIDASYHDTDVALFDANGDGNLDIYVASGGYHDLNKGDKRLQDRIYMGDGMGNFSRKSSALPSMLTSSGCVAVGDVNNDGHYDLFVGGRLVPGRYPEIPQSFLLVNDGQGNFSHQTTALAPELERLGLVTDALWVDLNADKIDDLVVVGEWMPISVFISKKGRLIMNTADYFDAELSGWWNTIETSDFNQDGKPDFIVGNIGTNTQFSISDKEPAALYYKDFDGNGAIDPLFCYYIAGKSYPYVTRDELLGQLANLRSRYTNYKSYADATIQDIFNENDLSSAKKHTANYMKTALLLSTEGATYGTAPLPLQVQFSPIHSISIADFNGDGKTDMTLFGNNHHYKLRLGKFDANYGLLLTGDGSGGFQYIDQLQSGLNSKGAVNSSIRIDDLLLLGVQGKPVKAYKIMSPE